MFTVKGPTLLFLLTLLIVLPATVVPGQIFERLGNPIVATQITHPPGLGLQVTKVAFGPTAGDGALEFVDALTQEFLRRNVEVLERERLQVLLKEHDFTLTAYVDRQSAAAIGKIIGPSVMILVNMQRRAVEKKSLYADRRDRNGYVHRRFISRTQAFIRGSVRSVDLATGRIFTATVLEANPSVENVIEDQCCPEFPSEYDVLDSATREVVDRATRLFLPWTETVKLVYFDDKDCGLKEAYSLQKAGDIEGALRRSLTNLEQCKSAPTKLSTKVLAHAYHNVGMGYLALGQPEKALEFLQEAQTIRPAGIHAEALAECRKADALMREARRVEEKALVAEEVRQGTAKNIAANVLTNKDIMDMVKAKLPAEVITHKIKISTCEFNTTTAALIELKTAGVPDSVVVMMLESQKR